MRPAIVIPWQNDFLKGLIDVMLADAQDQGHDLGDCLVVFPHRRPRRYLLELFRRDRRIDRPCLLPQVTAVSGLFSRIRNRALGPALRSLNLLDQAALLQDCVAQSLAEDPGPGPRFPVHDPDAFFPWGVRLAGLMEELLRHSVTPRDMHHLDDMVLPFARNLLSRLGDVHARYLTTLERQKLTTPGLDSFLAAQAANQVPEMLPGSVYLAGFHALTGTEEALFQALHRAGKATILLHSDPALADPSLGPAHWSCREHASLLKRFKTRALLASPPEERGTTLRFVEGFDLHSQLAALQQNDIFPLPGPESGQEQNQAAQNLDLAALILPDTGLLMPCLHHLSRKDVNVSMGYPLARSTLAQLIETLLRLQENSREPGHYYWQDLLDCIRHPYLKMLSIDGEKVLRRHLRDMEKEVRGGDKFVDVRALFDRTIQALPADETLDAETAARAGELLNSVLENCLTSLEQATTLQELAAALQSLCRMLLDHGHDLWARFPIDWECLHRLFTSVIPALDSCISANKAYPAKTLFAILRTLLETERAPFEAEPLTGLQVMGMLESRLLRFKQVTILDAVDNKLPGSSPQDPLLPDGLRRELGLPDSNKRDQVTAYNFHRLIKGAEQVRIYYRTGVEGKLLDQKSVRSRFVEELIWGEEQRRGKLLEPGQGPVNLVSFPLRSLPVEPRAALRTPAVDRAVARLLSKPISPTCLDTYLHCPYRFFLQYLGGMEELQEIDEDENPAQVGSLVHDALKEYFEPHLGRPLGPPQARNLPPATDLQDIFSRKFAESILHQGLSYDLRLALEQTARYKLGRYLEEMPSTTVLFVEETLEGVLETPSAKYTLTGKVDRVDERGQEIVILDYKTGTPRKPALGFWENNDLWERMAGLDMPESDNALLPDLAEKLHSVQLPCYMLMYGLGRGQTPHDAALVDLGDSSEEKFLLGSRCKDRERIIAEGIPALIAFVLEHMARCESFPATPGPRCQWCRHRGGCAGVPQTAL